MNEEYDLLAARREELYEDLRRKLAPYLDKHYESDDITEAQADRSALKKIEAEWKGLRKKESDQARDKMERIEEVFEEGIRWIHSASEESTRLLRAWDEVCAHQRLEQVRELVRQALPDNPLLADRIADSPAFLTPKMLKGNIKGKAFSQEVKNRALSCLGDIQHLLIGASSHAEALLVKYLETMDLTEVRRFRSELEQISDLLPKTAEALPQSSDRRIGNVTLKISATLPNLEYALQTLSLLDVSITELSREVPPPPTSVASPIFNDFVSVDLETTGSLGAKSGDAPAEITEIGAVKVRNGKITERFSILCNPGRSITPYCSALTHITNEMVQNQPPVSEGIKQFLAFAEDLPWVGHDLLNNDLPLFLRAASPLGIALSPTCFDTFTYAFSHKAEIPYPGLSLEALARHYQIEHGTLHRATKDAEVCALVYLRMKQAEETT